MSRAVRATAARAMTLHGVRRIQSWPGACKSDDAALHPDCRSSRKGRRPTARKIQASAAGRPVALTLPREKICKNLYGHNFAVRMRARECDLFEGVQKLAWRR